MFTQKINYIWIVNLLLLIVVVFLGIEQASRGANISILEDKLESAILQKRELTENIFKSGNESSLFANATDLGFTKPSRIYYFNSIDTVASTK